MVTIGIWERKFNLATETEIPMRLKNPESGSAPQISPEGTHSGSPLISIETCQEGVRLEHN